MMRKGFYAIGVSLVLLFVHGCSTVQAPVGAVDSEARQTNWKKRVQRYSTLSNWQLDGRASVTYRGENWPFGLQWLQKGAQNYDMLISHPLTQNTLAKIEKSAGTVLLTTDNGRTLRDSSAERLLEQQLKVKIPVEGMQYWVRGINAPQYPLAAYKLDGQGRPLSITQAGWNITYSGYHSSSYDALPTLISVQRSAPENVQVKLRVKQWRS